MIIDCAHYRDGKRQNTEALDVVRAAELSATDDGFVWLGLFEPDEAELGDVQRLFGLHELAVEDAQTPHLRPKVERYEDDGIVFAVVRTAHYLDEQEEVEFGEVSVFVSSHFVITVRQGRASGLTGVRRRLESHPDLLSDGPAAVLWAIVDTIVDDYVPVIEGLDRDVEEVEATVFSGATAPTERIYLLRQEATEFYRAVHPLLAPLEDVERGRHPEVSSELVRFFRDVNDHVKLINEEVAVIRDTLAMILQANMAVISNQQTVINVRQNETMKVLTLVATIFLPLTTITGFFGMNFLWMTDHIETLLAFLLLGPGSLIVSVAVLYWWFRREGHIGSERRSTTEPLVIKADT